MREISLESLAALKAETKLYYNSLKGIYSPYFGEVVRFTSEGFHHICYKNASDPKERDKNSQYMRLKLFRLAPKLLRDSKTVQEYFCDKQFVTVKHNKRKEKVLKEIKYWGFVGIIDDRRIKVVVRQQGDGEKKFLSIIPNWGTRNFGESRVAITHTGDIAND
ncbi:MAG: hypothetical protein WC285_05380 [Candidatus Gracilibacteria bacterium]|jgi:hypothetical protein